MKEMKNREARVALDVERAKMVIKGEGKEKEEEERGGAVRRKAILKVRVRAWQMVNDVRLENILYAVVVC